jgi:arylsulfatase A-like enzyme
MFSGLWSHQHGATTQSRKIDQSYPVLAEYLRKQGYYTLMVTSNAVVTDIFGLNRGFDETVKIWEEVPHEGVKLVQNAVGALWRPRFRRKLVRSFIDRRMTRDLESIAPFFRGYAPEILERSKQRISELRNEGKKVFLFINFYDTHFPYLTSDRFKLETRGIKRIAELAQLGDIIGNSHMRKVDYRPDFQMLKHIKARQEKSFRRLGRYVDEFSTWLRELDSNSTIVFGADHGENFGERKQLYHFNNVTEAGNRVPLIWSSSGQTQQYDVDVPVSLKDVFQSFLYETEAATDSPVWHIAKDAEESLSVIQAYWYDANGKTRRRYRQNHFAFIAEDAKYIHRKGKWFREGLEDNDAWELERLSKGSDAVEEARLRPEMRKRMRRVWEDYQTFERGVAK